MSRRAISSSSRRACRPWPGTPRRAGAGARRQRFADDAAGGRERQVGDLAAQLADGALLLRLDLRGRPDAHPLELLAGRGDVRVARLLGDLLGARQDVVRLAARLGQGGDPLGLGALAVATGLLGVLEALLDPLLALVEHLRDGLERERVQDREEQRRSWPR